MKILLLIIAWTIIFQKLHQFSYANKEKRSWRKYILFSIIASSIIPLIQLYTNNELGTLQENITNASVIAIATFVLLIGGVYLKMKIDEWSEEFQK